MLNDHKHILSRAFVDFLFDNDEKVASSYNYTPIKVRVQKPYPICDQNGRNQLKMTNRSRKTIPFGAAHTYIADIKEYPGGGNFLLSAIVCTVPRPASL